MSDTGRIETELEPFICGPCRTDRHSGCRAAEWSCECPHVTALAPAPAAVSPHAPGDAAAGGAAGASWGSGVSTAPMFPRPDWWGEHGCREAGQPGHVCLDVWGRPVDGARPCITEQRAAMADLFETYRGAVA